MSAKHMFRQGGLSEHGDLKLFRESTFLFSERTEYGKEADERSGLCLRLRVFAGGPDAGSQKFLRLSQLRGDAALAEFHQYAIRLHENSKVDLQSKARRTTSSIESKGAFKLLDSPPDMSSDGKPTWSSPSPNDPITVEGRDHNGRGGIVDSRLMLASSGADAMNMDSTSSKDFASPKFEKNLTLDPGGRSCKVVDAAPVKRISVGRSSGMLLGLNGEQTSSSGTRSSPLGNEEPSAAWSGGRDARGIIASTNDEERRGNPSSNPTGAVGDLEQSNRWVKRLRMQSADSSALGRKRSRADDVSSSAEARGSPAGALNCIGSISDANACTFTRRARTGNRVDGESSVESLSTRSWIRRWCRDRRKVGNTPQETAPDTSMDFRKANAQSSGTGERSPSVAAMALMAKAVGNVRPCKFRRRGPLLVWNLEEVRH